MEPFDLGLFCLHMLSLFEQFGSELISTSVLRKVHFNCKKLLKNFVDFTRLLEQPVLENLLLIYILIAHELKYSIYNPTFTLNIYAKA